MRRRSESWLGLILGRDTEWPVAATPWTARQGAARRGSMRGTRSMSCWKRSCFDLPAACHVERAAKSQRLVVARGSSEAAAEEERK